MAGRPAPTLPVSGLTAAGEPFRVTVEPSLEPIGPGGRLEPAWCPRVDLSYAGGRRTHGAVGCRPIRPHIPTGGYAIFCRSPEVFVLLLTSSATRSVSVESAPGRSVALTPFRGVVAGGLFWLGHYAGRSSPVSVSSLEGATRHVQRYPANVCIGRTPANGLLGR